MDKTVRGRARMERGNTHSGTTKKSEISRTLLSINQHCLVHLFPIKHIPKLKQKKETFYSPWEYSSFLLNHSGSGHSSSTGTLMVSRYEGYLGDSPEGNTTGDVWACGATQQS